MALLRRRDFLVGASFALASAALAGVVEGARKKPKPPRPGATPTPTPTPVIILSQTPSAPISPPPPAVFDFEGYGSTVTGGTGQTVVHVTNTNDTGAGSLRTALAGSNRIIVFDVSGTITFGSLIEVTARSNITIDGTTASITLRGWPLVFVGCTNVIIQGLRFRDQDRPGTGDSLSIKDGCTFFVVDRCSLSGASDGSLDISTDCTDITVQRCFLGGQGAVSLTAFRSERVTYHHNLFYEGGSRQPQIGSAAVPKVGVDPSGDVRCNLIWAPVAGLYGTAGTGGETLNVVRNYYYLAPGRTGVNFAVHTETGATAFSSGNFDKRGGSTATSFPGPELSIPAYAVVTMEGSALLAAQAILTTAGCRSGSGLDTDDQAKVDAINAIGL